MQRIQNGTQLSTLPTLDTPVGTPGYFGRTADGLPAPTKVGRDWHNMIQEELAAIVTAAGLTLSGSSFNQVLAAIQILIGASGGYADDTGAANAYVIAPTNPIGAYAEGQTFRFKALHANTGASTLVVSGLAAKAVTHRDGSALMAGDIPAGSECMVIYDATQFQLVSAEVPTLFALASKGRNPGDVFWHASATAPANSLECNGAAVSRTTYAALFAAIGTVFGAGNGSTTFNVPDLRGQFLRGYDDGRGVDSGRAFGTTQADAFKSHSHTINGSTGFDPYVVSVAGSVSESPGYLSVPHIAGTDATGGAETRPTNVALLPCIQY